MLLDSFGEIAVYDINHIKKNVIKAPTAVKPHLLFAIYTKRDALGIPFLFLFYLLRIIHQRITAFVTHFVSNEMEETTGTLFAVRLHCSTGICFFIPLFFHLLK